MSKTPNRFFALIMPYIGMGIFILLFVIGLVLFSYILLIGAILGLILFAVAYIRAKIFRAKMKKHQAASRQQGRIIEHD